MSTVRTSHQRCVLLFTKPARPGRVKTRLIGELTPEEAAELHHAFLADLRRRLARGAFDLRLAWALADGEPIPPSPEVGVRQAGEDLGERLFTAMADAARCYPAVVAVGSDHPELPLERVEEAFDRLSAGSDAVFGPAEDGGYYLVGLAAGSIHRELFEGIPWSTDRVMHRTLRRCRAIGLSVALLAVGPDVDRPEDLERLASRLAAADVDCPETRSLLVSWGRLGEAGR